MNDTPSTETDRACRLYEATLRAIAIRTEEPGAALIARKSLACVEPVLQMEKAGNGPKPATETPSDAELTPIA